MDKGISIPLPSVLLKATRARADLRPKAYAPNSLRHETSRTAGLSRNRVSRQEPAESLRAYSAPAPLSPRSSAQTRALPAPPPQAQFSGRSLASPAPPPPSSALHRSPGLARPLHAPPQFPELAPPQPRPFRRLPPRLRELQQQAVSSPWRHSLHRKPTETPAKRLAFAKCLSDDPCEKATSGFGPKFCFPEIPRNYLEKTDVVKAQNYIQNGKLLVFDPKEKVVIKPNETMSEKEVSSKNIENKVSLKNTENRVSSKCIEKKDTETNLQSKLWPSSFLKESTGEVGKDEVIANHGKNNEYCLQDIDDKLSESTDDDGEDDTSDEDNEDSNPNSDTHAPLELMAEFLRAEMCQDYHLAKKLCQMILIYEPENPEAKEFLSLIEEMLLMEKSPNLEEDDKDSEEDSSGESEGESSEELSEGSSDECEDG
ncbi:glutamate-rich protein 2 [Phyllostomus hastatus]|uniref:glutamate-rich protein 2 n=1 Tax=Phyllostomus hastatus TaxID=9423 RepID=UPI001E67F026|nr:glutamate-rich protein 2 [Phyllostomus hastatus]